MKRPALAALLLLVAPVGAFAQTFGSDTGDDFRTLTREESAKVLADFRNYRGRGDQRLRFVITHAERRSDEETRYVGELCATWGKAGMVTRLDIRPEGKPASANRAFLIVNGDAPALYELGPDGRPRRADADILKPLLPGLVFTPYDLQLPFIHWSDFKYRETERFRTRPTDFFRMTPPVGFKNSHPEITSVNLGFDRAYHALMRAETLGEDNRPLRELRAESFGKIRGEWIIRAMKLRDEKTRDADTLEVQSAALGLDLPAETLSPVGLAAPLPFTPESAFSKAD